MTVSADSCVATKTGGGDDGFGFGDGDWDASSVSQHPVTRYAVRVNHNGIACNGGLVVGLIYRGSFVPMGDNHSLAKSYCWFTGNGSLYGNGANGKAYAGGAIADGSIIECVRNRQNKTISFIVNGVDKGVAFTAVPDEDLHGLANIYCQKIFRYSLNLFIR